MSDQLAARAAEIVGRDHVLVDPELTAAFECDWSGRFSGPARFVVRPADTEEVAAVLRACWEAEAPVVPQGGCTGLVGAGVPRGGEVLLSLTRLRDLGTVDTRAAQVTAGAGATLAAVQAHARAAGLELGVDHAARDSATIGGCTATNAGGIRALRFGSMRANVAGLEAVLADGSVLGRLGGLAKDNAGYDLPGLLVGSEGTLAVVTKVRLRLVPALPRRATVLAAVADTEAAVGLLGTLRGRLETLDALELFYADGLALVCTHLGLEPPFDAAYPVYVLAECAARHDPLDELADAVESADAVLDTRVAVDGRDREALWTYREAHTEAVRAAGVAHKLDVALPPTALPEFDRRVRERVERLESQARTIVWGHLADGNLHVNVLGLDPADERVDAAVLELVAELGGSIGAEHGIGVAKARWLPLTRSEVELVAMRRLKQALDPRAILNPGVLFDMNGGS